MAKEALDVIFAAEEAANTLVSEARKEAAERQASVERELAALRERITKETRSKIDQMEKVALSEADLLIKPLNEESKKQAAPYLQADPAWLNKMVKKVLTEVTDGHR